MLKHYLIFSIKKIRSNLLLFWGSVATIFLATLCISFLYIYVDNEISMDGFHKRADDIFFLTYKESAESIPSVLGISFEKEEGKIPELENYVSITRYLAGKIKFSVEDNSFSPKGISAGDQFFEVFDFRLIEGDRSNVLSNPNGVVLTKGFAEKLFGNTNPVGKPIQITAEEIQWYTVTGIIEDVGNNSSISFEYILPLNFKMYNRMGASVVMLNHNSNKEKFCEKISEIAGIPIDVIALRDVYFTGASIKYIDIISKFGNQKNVLILMITIVLIFIISLLNLSNLQIINVNSKFRNVGIFKVTGATTKHLIAEKIADIFVLLFFTLFFVTTTFYLFLPYFNQLFNSNFQPVIYKVVIINTVIIALLVCVALIYPIITYLKSSITLNLKDQCFSVQKLLVRKTIAISQMVLSIVLLIVAIVISKQMDLMLQKDLGFNSQNIMHTRFFHELHHTASYEEILQSKNNYQVFKDEMSSCPYIKNYAQAMSPIEPFIMPWKIQKDNFEFSSQKTLTVTPEFLNILELEVKEGRFFDYNIDKSRIKKAVINEAAQKFWGIADIDNQQIINKSWGSYEIIGVVKDFNFEHLSMNPQPLVMLFFEDMEDDFLVQFEEGSTAAGVQFVEQLFKKFNLDESFEYSFLADNVVALYQKERHLSNIYIFFTIIALFISSIGLFAISLYDTRARIKEIGIRKINGACISEILAMLNKDFIKWVVIAFIIATPIAYYAMHKWLENFAYKTSLSWWIFGLAGILALGIALLTVSWQSWRAATRNPVEALRYE